MPSRKDMDAAMVRANETLRRIPGDLVLGLGVENMWDEVFYERAKAGTVQGYGDGPAFLFELHPREIPPGLMDQIFAFRRAGRQPVLAHPERYEPLWDNVSLVEQLAQECALLVDLGAVAGRHGKRQEKAARHLLKNGLAHAVASDVHTVEDLQGTAEGIEWIRRKLGEQALEMLLSTNPRRILDGEHPS
jgi:protein-tyrosine phosphatase